jgi:outer membrane receptor protein involved in Fe transport
MSVNRIYRLAAISLLLTVFFQSAHAAEAPATLSEIVLSSTEDGQVVGQVIDADTGEPFVAATVAVRSAEGAELVGGAITNGDGQFLIDRLPTGNYYVEVSFVGFKKHVSGEIRVSPTEARIELGPIQLAPDTQMLEGVEVTAERETVTFEIDRTVYTTRDQIVSSGGSATDVLQNVPSVEVDIDGNVSLRGNQNVTILVNGKPAPARGDAMANFLRQIPADMVERVEVIPNPSAKFDPDGMAGALNIVLKKDTGLGTSGGLALGIGTGDKYNASGNVSLQKDRLTLFSSYGFRSEDRSNSGFDFRENRFLDPLTYLEQDRRGDRNRISHTADVSADFSLSEKNTLNASFLASTGNSDNKTVRAYYELDNDRALSDRYDRTTLSADDGTNLTWSVGFDRTVDPQTRQFSARLRYNRETDADVDEFTEQAFSPAGSPITNPLLQNNDLDRRSSEWNLEIDDLRTIGGVRIETGYKGILRTLDNSFFSETLDQSMGMFRPDVNLNNDFVYDEQVHALYGLASGKVGRFEYQAGARVEQALTSFNLSTSGEEFENDYFSLFPSAFLAYNPTAAQQVKLSYSKRINRPRTRALNPFATYSDPLNLYVGNPYLKAEYTHSFELAFQRFFSFGSASLTPYYRRTVDAIQRFKTMDDTGVSTLTWRNFDTNESYGVETVVSARFGKSLRGFASANVYRVVTDGSSVDTDLSNDAISWSANGNVTWQVRDDLDVQISHFYRAPTDIPQGRISSFSVTRVSVRQKILNGRGSLSLSIRDPLNRMGFGFAVGDEAFYQEGERKWESRIAYLTFSYNFGQPPRNAKKRRDSRPEGAMEGPGMD